MVSSNPRKASAPRGLMITDGAMGTELWRAGWPRDRSTALATLERPDLARRIHRAYLEAGARALLTNTFLAADCRLDPSIDAAELNRKAVHLARQAGPALVFGDLGPVWDLLAPRGHLSAEDAKGSWVRQAVALIEAGADGLVFETLSSTREIALALAAARAAAPRLRLSVSLSLTEQEGEIVTLAGEPLSVALEALASDSITLVGFNCGTLDLSRFAKVVRRAKAAGLGPIWIRAGAGLTPKSSLEADPPVGPDDFARQIPEIVEAGATWLGGCCGTRPEHIAAIARALERHG